MIPDIIVSKIKKNAGKRMVAAYGWSEKTYNELRLKGIDIEKCFTGNKNLLEQDKKNFFVDISELNGKSEKYYTIILITLMDKPDFQKNIMKNYGFEEMKDYTFITLPGAVTLDTPQKNYSDNYGNVIKNMPANTTVILNGWGNRISFAENLRFSGKLRINIKGNNNEVEAGKGFTVVSSVSDISFSGSNNKCRIKENCRFTNSNTNIHIHFFDNGIFRCGKGTVISGMQATVISHTFMEIGEECLFSYEILAQTSDGHSIFDIDTGKNISSAVGIRKGIIIGNHVWVGMRSFLLPCEIGDGSVVGAQSVVKGKHPNNCVIAGSPARIVKKNIAWSIVNEAEDIAVCKEYVKATDVSEVRSSDRDRIKALEERVAELEEMIESISHKNKKGFFRR